MDIEDLTYEDLLEGNFIDTEIDEEDPGTLNVRVLESDINSVSSAQFSRADMLSDAFAGQRLDAPITIEGSLSQLKIHPTLHEETGKRRVVVRLRAASISEQMSGVTASSVSAQQQLNQIDSQQTAVVQNALAADGNARVLGQVQVALNAVMLEIDAAALSELAADPAVLSVNPVIDYEMDLSEVVPYVGAADVQDDLGFTGEGINVAIFDSGIDYFHANLGGSGDPADYANNDPNIIEEGTFPTDKVVGGFDFVGSQWTSSTGPFPEIPDPDPLDDGPGAGHGTSVADITAGTGGVAPDANLYAVKVCSSISTSCSGVALLQGMDFALDPNGDGDIDDKMDIINMSLGAPYGQPFDDDLSAAVENAAELGVLTVASAGNSGDKPYVTGSPSASPSALGVAQTNVPSAVQAVLDVLNPASIAGRYDAVFQPWSAPLTSRIQGPVQYGDGSGGNLNGCAPFTAGSLAGLIVLVDRGACNFTLKISNISQAGGLIGIIGLVAPGDPFSGGDGGDRPIDIPGYMINQADSNRIKGTIAGGVAVSAAFDPTSGLPLIGSVVSSSSRGPNTNFNLIKPEIGAPGASVSAIAGTGTGEGPFGGTSGAAPVVSGAAALVMQAYPERSIQEVKALLENTAETEIINKVSVSGPNEIAPITRVGGGEVRVDRAIESAVAAWDAKTGNGVLSFGFEDISKRWILLRKKVVLRNYSNKDAIYKVRPVFRAQDDVDTEAVIVKAPPLVSVHANDEARFTVFMLINGSKLRDWTLNSGSAGANGDLLSLFEYDGWLFLDGLDGSQIHLSWQVLPRKAGKIRVKDKGSALQVKNSGVGATTVDSYSLIGVSDNLPEGGPGEQNPTPDLHYFGYSTIPVPAGFCGPVDSFVMAFAVNAWERENHAIVPASFRIFLDTDQDGTNDYLILNADVSLNGVSDGRALAWVVNLATGSATAFFFATHSTNSANFVLFFCGDQIGMNASNFFQPMNVTATVIDNYFTGNVTDIIDGITISPLGERYLGIFEDGGLGTTTLEFKKRDTLKISDTGVTTNNTENGLLLLFTNGAGVGEEAGVVIVQP